jgi:hypothetical protein
VSQLTGKPNSVSRRALRRDGRRPFLYAGDCSPAPATYPVTFASAEAKAARTGRPITPPYLALLRAGFCLPPTLPPARCALTAPFHPYPSTRRLLAEASRSGRYIFCATVRQVTLPGRYPAHCPSEFGLSSRFRAEGATADGRLANCDPLLSHGRASCHHGRSVLGEVIDVLASVHRLHDDDVDPRVLPCPPLVGNRASVAPTGHV